MNGRYSPRPSLRKAISPALLSGPPGVSRITGAPACRHDLDQGLRVDLAVRQWCMAIPARSRFVAGIVAVHKVDASGDRRDVLHGGGQVDARCVRVTGVENESRPEFPDGVPESRDRLEVPGHRLVAAGGVLDQDRQRKAAVLRLPGEDLAPVVKTHRRVGVRGDVAAVHDQPHRTQGRRRGGVRTEELATRDPDPVVRRRDVEHVRGVDEDRQPGRTKRIGVRVRLGALPALRVREEDLHTIRAGLPCLVHGVGVVLAGADMYTEHRHAGQGNGAPRRRSRATARRRAARRCPCARLPDRPTRRVALPDRGPRPQPPMAGEAVRQRSSSNRRSSTAPVGNSAAMSASSPASGIATPVRYP